MKWIKYIIDYWAQIAILLAALGYILKVILDNKFRRKEIWYSLYAQKKMDYALKYLELYYKVESKTLGMISVFKTGEIIATSSNEELDILNIVNLYTEAGQLLGCLEFFITKKEYRSLKQWHIQIGQKMQILTTLLQKRAVDNLLVNEFENLYKQTLAVIQANNKELFLLR